MESLKGRVLLVANTAWYLYNFRRTLARTIRDAGFEPVFVSPSGEHANKLIQEGYRWIEFPLERSGVNPFQELKTLFRFIQIYREQKPVVVHHFTIKCVLYGTLAAKVTGVPLAVNAITGLGHFMIGESLKAKFFRPLVKFFYKKFLSFSNVQVIFQNQDDHQFFLDTGMVKKTNSHIIRSSGVDVSFFSPASSHSSDKVVLFGGRLLKEKGIREYVEAARILKNRGVKAQFWIAGSPDEGNPSSITNEELAEWKKRDELRFLGQVHDMKSVFQKCSMAVLPSYREGTPKFLLEAAAMEKSIVATDVPGCREAVDDGVNGRLVRVKDAESLAKGIQELIENQELASKMGKAGREKIMREFDDRVIAAETVKVYSSAPSK